MTSLNSHVYCEWVNTVSKNTYITYICLEMLTSRKIRIYITLGDT